MKRSCPRKLIELYPTASEAHYQYALVLSLGRITGALSEFERESLTAFAQWPPLALDAWAP